MSLHVPDMCKCIPAGFTTYVASYHVLTTGLHSKNIFKILSQERKKIITSEQLTRERRGKQQVMPQVLHPVWCFQYKSPDEN